MKTPSLLLAVSCAVAPLVPIPANGFSIASVTLSPSNIVPPSVELKMTIDIVTPSQGTWLYAPTQISSNATGIRVDVFPTSGMLTAIGSLRETVNLGGFPPGIHNYEVVIHPNFNVNWGTRTNRGSFTVTDDSARPEVYISATRPETLEPSATARVAPGEFTITRIGNTNEPLILFVEFSGTATFGQDYQEVSQYVTMPAGERKVTVLVGPLDDSQVEGDETVIATLSPNPPIGSLPNYTVHPRLNSATVVIHDNDFPSVLPVVSVSGPSTVLEYCPPNADCIGISFVLRRTGPGLDQPLYVFIRYRGTATAGVDYETLPAPVTFEAGSDTLAVSSIPIDDTLYEGDETIIAEVLPLTTYHVDPNRWQATTVIRDNEAPAPSIVSLELVNPYAAETRIDQNAIFWAEFRVLRTGPTTDDLTVFLNTQQGSARLGEDYWLDRVTNGSVRIPAGVSSVNVRLYPIDDDFYEGEETVFFHLIAPPPGSNPYQIDHPRSSVSMVIRDNDPVTTRLDITSPRNGQHFEAGEVIRLQSQIIGPGNSNSWTVEFFDGDNRIGSTRAGGAIFWDNAIGGPHVINARAYNPAGVPGQDTLVARPVTITVGPGPAWPVVAVYASHVQTLEPCPVCFVAPAIFTISRTGPTTEALNVYLEYDGPAKPGVDYHTLSNRVTIPPGTNAVQLPVLARDDLLVEGPEIVRATIVTPELATLGYIVSAFASEAMIVINDDERGAPEIRLDIAEPREGAQFAVGTTIRISALGVWTRGEVDGPVEFFAGNVLIGRSDPPQFGRPTIPGLPSVHTIFWTNPPPGRHALTARFERLPGLSVTSLPVNVTVGANPTHPIVSIGTTDSEASEFPPHVDAFDPATFRIFRSGGDLSRELLVFFSVGGSAIPGHDYRALESPVRIPAGEQAVTLEVVALHDDLAEGTETVYIRLEPSPLVGPLPTYEVNPHNGDAAAVILDDEVPRAAAVEIVSPANGQNFVEPSAINIVVAAYHPTRDILRVDFYADGTKIGESIIVFDKAYTGGLIVHRFLWTNPTPGPHVLTAQGFNENNKLVATAPPVRITVGPEGPRTVVSIEAAGRIAEETSAPLRRIRFDGEFTISRKGPVNSSLPVWMQYSGTATGGKDYAQLPLLVTIPAGSNATTIRVEATPDDEPEGIETLVATISNCPPPWSLAPCYDFDIDPARASATVFIRDDGITEASLVITKPHEGETFRVGETVLVEATAIHLEGYISRVEFWAGDRQIGVSEIVFIRAPDPGTPIHHSFEWQDAPAGTHQLTARAGVEGARLRSAPVHIVVGPTQNQLPAVRITRPAAGEEFPANASIEIVTDTRDPDGYVRRMEFFTDGRKIGESIIEFIRPPEPNQPQTFSFTWLHPMPGLHRLTAQATDDDGGVAISAPVEIRVSTPDALPIVIVATRDAFAVEPGSNSVLNTAAFRLRRIGPTNEPLTIRYALEGRAENGVDYERLSGEAIIPAGRRSTTVTVKPLADNLTERTETVVLRLEERSDYRRGLPNRAVAVIADRPWLAPPRGVTCARLLGGGWHLCFAAESGYNFRVEATSDFLQWETVFEAPAADGALHFIEEEAPARSHRFYRLAPEPMEDVED